jgi:hypothetical protein
MSYNQENLTKESKGTLISIRVNDQDYKIFEDIAKDES